MTSNALPPTGPEGGPPRPAVLVVDDDERNLLAISEILSDLNAEIVLAKSGTDALRLILRRDFCAILLDVRMPEMDGYATAETIRQRVRSRNIPIIFLTAYDKDAAHVHRGYSAGAVDYVFKPVEAIVLRAKVSVFVELQRQAEEIARKAEQERRLLEENLRVRAEQIETEERLRSTERREALIVRSLPIAVYEGRLEHGRAVRTFLRDEGVKRLMGFEAAEFAEKPTLWADRVHPEDWPGVLANLESVAPGKDYSIEYRWQCPDGGYRYFLDQGVFGHSAEDGCRRTLGTMFDVHERRMLQQQLLHAQKIDAIGKLTGGIVHDFNNMLTVVIGNLDSIKRTEGLDSLTARRVEHALQGGLHCRDMTKRLLGFAHNQALALQVIDLNELINNLADLLKRTLAGRIDVCMDLASDLWPVRTDAGQVEAAIINLLFNARDAMPDGGSVGIRTANVESEPGTGHGATVPPGRYVVLEIADTGIGMSEEVLARACEPFFTTKHGGRGTGLGLSTIDAFARQCGGGLHFDSEPDRGTRVRLFLPCHDAIPATSRSHRQKRQAALPRAGNNDLVLVVEDDETVRRTSTSTLRELGYRVFEAENATSALEVLQRTDGVRLLFTDVIMPGSANGYQLASEAVRLRPDLKVLYTSAYGGDIAAGDEGIGPFLRKPYRDYELAHAIRTAIDLD